MKKELQDKLFAKFPKLFREKDLPKTKSCMFWGISCGDGWYTLIDALCVELTEYGKKEGLDIVANQVKEKLAGLRFDVSGADGGANNIIGTYERMSYHVCELCSGEEGGKKSDGSWLHTMCNSCWDKWQTGWRPWEEK